MGRVYARGTFTGAYHARGNPLEADALIGCAFAQPASEGQFWGLANEDLAAFISRLGIMRRVPLLLDRNIARALERKFRGPEPALTFTGEASALTSLNRGTKGELAQSLAYLEAHDLRRPVIVGQAHHIGRIALQAERLGMEPIIPPGLPDRFDPGSVQPWPHGPVAWAIREAIGLPVLHLTGKL